MQSENGQSTPHVNLDDLCHWQFASEPQGDGWEQLRDGHRDDRLAEDTQPQAGPSRKPRGISNGRGQASLTYFGQNLDPPLLDPVLQRGKFQPHLSQNNEASRSFCHTSSKQ